MPSPRVAIGPQTAAFAAGAVEAGGGEVVERTASPDAIVWLDPADMAGLSRWIEAAPGARWVQLPFAGVERAVASGLFDEERIWTCAKGSYGEPVAEHALALGLAGLRRLPSRVVASEWGSPAGTSLFDQKVTILGAGGIAASLLELLAPFRVEATVVRRRDRPMPGAARTVGEEDLHAALSGALLVVVALALTPETSGVIGSAELAAMDRRAWLVNVARGPHVDTDALVEALTTGSIAGAALDVTDPEPLPVGHPLWDLPNCIITPHTANTMETLLPRLAERIRENVARFGAGDVAGMLGLVDPAQGY